VTIGSKRFSKILKYNTANDEFYINKEIDTKSPKQKKKKDKSFLSNKKREAKYTPPIIFVGRI